MLRRLTQSLVLLTIFAATGHAQRPSLRAGAGAERVRIDGWLDEPVWAEARTATLTQVEPTEGGPAAARTTVRILAGPKMIVVGIVAMLPPGTRVTAFSKARDAELRDEDHVRVVIDPYSDGRSGYLFAVNPLGARYDAQVTNQGEGANPNWDALWDASARITDSSWSVEIRIPVSSLSFPAGAHEWAVNVQRRIQGRLETDRWATPDRDVQFGSTARAGRLTDLPRFDLGIGLTVRPALVSSAGHPGPGTPLATDARLSLDVEQRLSSNLLGSLTARTDFAETEADVRRTNLTRFPLFYPEKRRFFLEGTDVFEFGLGLRQDLAPFFSRRIGLVNDRQVPIDIGGKVSGQVGTTRLGAIMIHTGRDDSVPSGQTLAAFRVRQNVLAESSIGALATFGDPLGGRSAWTAGADATFRTSHFGGNRNLLAGIWFLANDAHRAGGDHRAFGAMIDYPNDQVDLSASWKRLGDGFDPALGFVPRTGVNLFKVSANLQPRPGRFGVRQAFFENQLTLVTDLRGRWESYRMFVAPVNFRLESGDRIEANVVPQGERLTEPFEIAPGVSIAPGAYRFTRYRLEVEAAARRRVSGQATWWFGRFYDGHLHQLQFEGQWKPSAAASVGLTAEHNIATLPAGDFTTTLVGVRLAINVSADLQINSLIQYDTESESFGSNSRLRWRLTPVTEMFLVYNHNVATRFDRWAFDSNRLALKLQHAFRR